MRGQGTARTRATDAGFPPALRYAVFKLCLPAGGSPARGWQAATAHNDESRVCINRIDEVTAMNGNRNTPARLIRLTGAAGIACGVIAALGTAIARAEDTSIKQDLKRAGEAVGNAAREVGHEAKNVGGEIAQGAKKVGGEIVEGAKKAGTEIAQGAKRVGGEIGTGAKTAGRVVGNAAKQTAEVVRDAPKNIKESMTGEKKE
jgi:hypothetical protein